MGRIAVELGALAVSKLAEKGLHQVGGVPGLALQILPSGGRSWILRVMVGGKRREMGLGGYPGVTLAGAREAARAARARIRAGVDPVQEAQEAAAKLRVERIGTLTFEQCAEKFITAHAPKWGNDKHVKQWSSTLATYAFPVFGALPVKAVELRHIMLALEPIWTTKTETATRLRGRIEQVLDWATAREFRVGPNPARWRGHLDKLLPTPAKVKKVEHQPALPMSEMSAFMARLTQVEGMSALALRFAIMTGARSGEVCGAIWSEIDKTAGMWVIPGERMKAGKEHRVPLVKEVLALLETVPRMAGSEFVFTSPRGGQLSDMSLSMLIRRLSKSDNGRWVDPKTGRVAVPHGFRSTLRDWAAEQTNYPRELAEVALAHVVAGKTEAAYWRGDMLTKRTQMMRDWVDFLATA